MISLNLIFKFNIDEKLVTINETDLKYLYEYLSNETNLKNPVSIHLLKYYN